MNETMNDKDVEDLSQSLGEACFSRAFNSCGRLISKYYSRLIKESGLKSRQFDLLMLLVKHKDKELTATQMADEIGMDRTTFKRNCDTMVKNGWVVLGDKSRLDARCWGKFKITALGMNHLKTAIPGWKKANTMVKHLIGDKVKEINSIGEKIKDYMPNV